MHIDDETTDVLIGGYLSTDAAHEDYEAVLDCGARLWGAVVVSKDLEGNLSVEETDHAVEEGAAGLAAVGFVVGPVRPAAARRHRHRRGARRRRRRGAPQEARQRHRREGRRHDPDRRRRPDRRLPALGGRAGRAGGDPSGAEGGRRGRGPPREGPQGRAGRRPAEDGRRGTEPLGPLQQKGGCVVAEDAAPHVLIVYFSFTQQTRRVADTMADALRDRGYGVTEAAIEFTDAHYGKRFSQHPMSRPIANIFGMLPAQLRKKTGEISIPPEASEATTTWLSSARPPGGSPPACRSAPTCTIRRQEAFSPATPSRCSPRPAATTRAT